MLKTHKRFSLLELVITVALLAVLFLTTLRMLLIAQRSESMQIRKSILAVEAKKAKHLIQQDLKATLFRSIDVTQKDIDLGGGGIQLWNKRDDFTSAEIENSFGTNHKMCSSTDSDGKPNCSWYFRSGQNSPSTSDDMYHFPNVNSGMQYDSSGSDLSGITANLSIPGRIWPGPNTTCPSDGAPLTTVKVPIKLVKMMTAKDRNGRFRQFRAGPKFGFPDWQGFIFYVNVVDPKSQNGKLVKYSIYKDDLDLEPRTVDIGLDTTWINYDGYEGVLDDNGRSVFPAIKLDASDPDVSNGGPGILGFNSIIAQGNGILPDSGQPVVGIPTLMDLFDFNRNGDIEIFPSEMDSDAFNPLGLSATEDIFGRESLEEKFYVELSSTDNPKIVWSKVKRIGPLKIREFLIEIDLRTHEVFWSHDFRGDVDPGFIGSQFINWSRTRTFTRPPQVIANNVAQWDMMTKRGCHQYWHPDFVNYPQNPNPALPPMYSNTAQVRGSNGILTDKFVRLTIVFDRPFTESGEYLHEEFVFETGFALR